MTPFELLEPDTVEEAISLLDVGDPAVRPIGGGTALMLMMKAQFLQPVQLVSLRRLKGRFRGFGVTGDTFRVGAMTTFSELERSAEVARYLPAIVQAMPDLANVRVRNVASVGGNLAHADPHLDLPPIWMAMDAEVFVVGPKGERTIPLTELLLGYYETSLVGGELIAEVRLPLRPTWRTTYAKVTTRALHDWPALGLAISLELMEGQIRESRVVLSGALSKPTRLVATEAILRGAVLSEDLLRRAGTAAAEEADLQSDNRGSGDYKSHLLQVHLGRAVRSLSQRIDAR
jgi:carbon-monoxide dehydrogenase medium subunit